MAFERFDFAECAKDVGVLNIARVLSGWGYQDDGWEGGFLCLLHDGRYAYITGWCDYTGWG